MLLRIMDGIGNVFDHEQLPPKYHDLLTENGWNYHHSTVIRRMNEDYYLLHTYIYNLNNGWCISVNGLTGVASASRSGSSRTTEFMNAYALEAYCKRKKAELRRENRKNFAEYRSSHRTNGN